MNTPCKILACLQLAVLLLLAGRVAPASAGDPMPVNMVPEQAIE
jgi:hypothetical protein